MPHRLTSLICLLCFAITHVSAQVNWSEHIAPIIFNNCSSCHHSGGIAPFNLMSAEDMESHMLDIQHVLQEKTMPPWPADPEYRHFLGEAVLEEEEIQAILLWMQQGFLIGDESLAPPTPVFLPSGSLLDTIDYTISIPAYTLQSNSDEYRWFVLENPFGETFYISKLEVIAGLETVVHHADLFLDYTGTSMQYELADPLPGFNSSTGSPVNNHYINAWQPGGNIAIYPEGWGIKVEPDADLVIEIHYGPGGQGQTDDTKMNLQFVKNTNNVRPVKVGWLLNHAPSILIDGPLIIPANQVATFHHVTAPLTEDMSLISICPHMHFLGDSFRVWFESPDGEEVPLIYIPRWDFHWQKYYTFQQIQKIPAGSVIKSEGVYNNTTSNHDNPFNPPQTAYAGSTTLDEMFLCYFIFANYQEGDEDIVMDSTILITSTDVNEILGPAFNMFPNPTTTQLHVKGSNHSDHNAIDLSIYDAGGKLVRVEKIPDMINKDWEAIIDVNNLDEGLYYLEWQGILKPFVVMFSGK